MALYLSPEYHSVDTDVRNNTGFKKCTNSPNVMDELHKQKVCTQIKVKVKAKDEICMPH